MNVTSVILKKLAAQGIMKITVNSSEPMSLHLTDKQQGQVKIIITSGDK